MSQLELTQSRLNVTGLPTTGSSVVCQLTRAFGWRAGLWDVYGCLWNTCTTFCLYLADLETEALQTATISDLVWPSIIGMTQRPPRCLGI